MRKPTVEKWAIEFVKVKDGVLVKDSVWTWTGEDEGAGNAISKAVDEMVETVPIDECGYYRVLRVTNITLSEQKAE